MLFYKGFVGQIDFNSESQKLVGEVVNSIDLIEFEGLTAQELKHDFQLKIDEYLDFQKEVAGQFPIPFVGNFTICLTTEKQNQVIKAAQAQGQSVTHWLNQRIDNHLSRYFKKIA